VHGHCTRTRQGSLQVSQGKKMIFTTVEIDFYHRGVDFYHGGHGVLFFFPFFFSLWKFNQSKGVEYIQGG